MIKTIIKLFKKLFHKVDPSEIYYINGAQILPPPLEAEEENEVIEGLASENEDFRMMCRDKLIEHNLRLVVYIAKKFENTGIGSEDLVSIGTIGLVKALNTFRPDKNIKIATYASKCIENEILMYIRKIGSTVSAVQPLPIFWTLKSSLPVPGSFAWSRITDPPRPFSMPPMRSSLTTSAERASAFGPPTVPVRPLPYMRRPMRAVKPIISPDRS